MKLGPFQPPKATAKKLASIRGTNVKSNGAWSGAWRLGAVSLADVPPGDRMVLGLGLALAMASGVFAISMAAKSHDEGTQVSSGATRTYGGLYWKQPVDGKEPEQNETTTAALTRAVEIDYTPTGSLAKSSQSQDRRGKDRSGKDVALAPEMRNGDGSLADYSVVAVADGTAVLEGRRGFLDVHVGSQLPSDNKIVAIEQRDGKWVVITAKGLIK